MVGVLASALFCTHITETVFYYPFSMLLCWLLALMVWVDEHVYFGGPS